MARTADTVYGNTIRYLIFLSIVLLFFTFSLASYSRKGYTLTKYPSIDGNVIVCVEGEVHPTNQSITVINLDDRPTVNPYVIVNNKTHYINRSVENVGVKKKINSLSLGCNKIMFGADSNTKFKIRLEYLSHWRPTIKSLEIANLKVGHSVRYFLIADTHDDKKIMVSRLNITDLTREVNIAPIFDAQFNGSAVRFKMKEAGNYRADMQVYDGYVWSDIYQTGFTSHVIVTNEKRPGTRIYELTDMDVLEHGGFIPSEVKPTDIQPLKIFKRFINGAYMLVKRTLDLSFHLLNEGKNQVA